MAASQKPRLEAPARRRPGRISRSTVASILMVVAAGVVTWYGLGSRPAAPPSRGAQAATLAPASVQAPAEPAVTPAAEGILPTRIVVPSAGIDARVSEVGVVVDHGRTVWETAWRSAGHHIDSARPGQPGNVVITGHVSVADRSNLAVFKSLDRVREGDVVELFAGDEVHRYAVTGVQVVEPAATRLLRSDHQAVVTLITCTKDLAHRLVVTGTLIS